MTSYRFSPIENKEKLLEAVQYVAQKSSELCAKVVGEVLPISSLTVFAHELDEYEVLCEVLKEMGESVGENKGPRVALHEPISAGAHIITHLRIRVPDAEHPQVGSNDYDIANYVDFKAKYLTAHPDNLRLIVRADYELIEFFDPEFDVLGYVLSTPERSKRGV